MKKLMNNIFACLAATALLAVPACDDKKEDKKEDKKGDKKEDKKGGDKKE